MMTVMERRSWFLAFVAAVMACAAMFLFRFTTESADRTFEGFVDEYLAAYEAEREQIAATYLQEFTTAELLAALEKNNALCHTEAHPIGRAVFRQTGTISDVIAQCSVACSYGCFHGGIMALFSTDSDTLGGAITSENDGAALAEIARLSLDLCARGDVASFVAPLECFHGIGHVMTYVADYDLYRAVAGCEQYADPEKVGICTGGAFMEFINDVGHRERVSRRNLYPCHAFPQYAERCFHYKGPFFLKAWHDFGSAVEACRTAESLDVALACIKGVGVAIGRYEVLETPDGLAGTCETLEGAERDACIVGAVSHVVFKMDGEAGGQCAHMAPKFRTLCLDILRKRDTLQ